MTARALDVPVPPHPAKFSAPIVAEIRRVLGTYAPTSPLFPVTVLDPFAGPGGIHQLAADGYATTGIEIEADWARSHPRTICADSTRMPIADASFDVVCTSPCYGNRMADTYDGSRDRCTACAGDGQARTLTGAVLAGEPCDACAGTGLRPSKRYTYRIALGHDLTDGSAAGMQWGHDYRELHRSVWTETRRVLKPRGLLLVNISDHIRDRAPQGVDLWHAATLGELGFRLVESRPIVTQRSKNGANRDARTLCEWLLVFRKGARSS
jgi:SAM-dependent methyltransferase